MSNSQHYQTRSTTQINKTINELSSDLPPTRKMTSSHLDQSTTTTTDTFQQTNNSQEENPILKFQNPQYKEENVSFSEKTENSLLIPLLNRCSLSQSALFPEKSQSSIINQHHSVELSPSMYPTRKTLTSNDMKSTLCPASSSINTEEILRSSVSSMTSQGFDLPTNTSSIPQALQLNSNMEKKRISDELQYTSFNLLSPTTTLDQTYFLKLEVDRLTKELELMKLQQSQQQPNTVRVTHPDASYSVVQQPTTTTAQLPYSNMTMAPIHVIINTDPLQQMKDFVKPFNGNPNDDVTKWIESIVHYFDIAQISGDKETLYFQYAPAFLKEYAYKWWADQKHYIFSWSIFKQALITQFAEKNEYLIEQQFDQRKQQINEPVIKYYYDIIDLCKKYDPLMSDKQKIRKLTNGLKLSLYQEAIKETYSTSFDFLIKVQQLENIQKLIELRQNQTAQVSTITKSDDKLSLSSQVHSYQLSSRQSNNHPTKSTYYSSSTQNDYPYPTQQSFSPTSNQYSPYEHSEFNQNQQYPISQFSQSQHMYSQPHSYLHHQHHSSGKSNIYCYNCGQPEVPDGGSSESIINPSPLSFITVPVNGNRLQCLLDTGASNTFIHTSTLSHIRHNPIKRIKGKYTLADGNTTVDIDGEVEIYIQIGHIRTKITAFISKSLSTSCILGQDWMRKYAVDICQSSKLIIIYTARSSAIISMDDNMDKHNFNLKLANTIVLKPQHETIVRLKSPISSSSNIIFHPNRNIQYQKLIAIPNALLTIQNYETYITIANPTNKICRIPIHTNIGYFTVQPLDIRCYTINSCLDNDQRSSNDRQPEVAKHDSIEAIFDQLLDHIQDQHEKSEIHQLLIKYKKIFDTSTHSIAKISSPPMINTGLNLPIHSRVYRTDPIKQQHISTIINDMLKSGQIQKSYSSWSSPVILVKKKDGTYRFVIDYRQLNNITERDSYPLPRIEETLNRLNGNNYFSKLDLKTGYHQIPIHSSDKEKTTFVTYNGMFQFNVMPQGLKNAPSSFQRIMYELLVNTRWDFCLVYIDDVIIFSRTFDQHVTHLNEVFSVLYNANLQLNPQKCSLIQYEINYLGHTINQQGIRPLQDNVDAIIKLPTPTTPKQVHSFVQAANYYRDHIENFSKIAAPLYPYTKKNAIWKGWTPQMENAFNDLKRRLTTPPVFLNFPDDISPLVLSTDASGYGMGGVLRQITPEGSKVIKYVSKKFNIAQKKYSTTERECLALVWCICKLKEYIWGRPIQIETDHCPLCSFNKKKFQNSRIERWQLQLSEYDITTITYKRGRCNCDADLISRFPYDEADIDDAEHPRCVRNYTQPSANHIAAMQINVITRTRAKQLSAKLPVPSSFKSSSSNIMTRSKTKKVNILPISETTPIPVSSTTTTVLHSPSLIDFSIDRIRNDQMNDIDIQTRIQKINDDSRKYLNDVVDQQLLYKLVTRNGHTKIKLPWIPISMIPDILSAYHDHPLSGHLGVNRTYHKIKDKFYWFQMLNSVKQYIRSCTQCAQFNVQRRKKPGLLQKEPPPEGVFELMQMDFWKAPIQSSDGNQYVLIITDRLSKYVFARALSSENAKAAAEMLFEDIILKHGAIRCIQSDQGSHFRNELLSAITQLTGCKQIFSIPYHPMSNGQVERFNSTFCDQLKKYYHDNINDWDIYLQSIVWAYNSSIHSITGFIPYELAFNRRLISPFEFPSSKITMLKPNDYWEKANKFKQVAIHAAQVNIEQQQQLSKLRYDKGRTHPTYTLDDMVWIKVLSGRSKLDPRYHGPFRIIKRITDVKYIVEHAQDHYQKEEHVNNFIPFYERI
ncbi:unnamed protein product [Rotaria sordida]|uniref:RNA-directed DNA polymerase n=1 Tax=Rotaria sordida TaxID=392033 RepID=A0A814AS91_9BILA|nr:unnamed protein product [Rotaria sordida]CAF3789495.1 unnamed protein product [Rotaria sordida]